MKCEEMMSLLDPLVDDELPMNEVEAVMMHMDSCNLCRAEMEALMALRERLRALERAPVPLHLRGSIIEALVAEERSRPPAYGWMRPALTHAAMAILGGVAVLLITLLPKEQAEFMQDIVSAHVRSLMQERLIEVAAGDRHKVKPWFAGKLDYSPIVIDLTEKGFPLAGARLDRLNGRDVAALVYSRRMHTINVFVVPESEHTQIGPIKETRVGYNIVGWADRGFRFWAISDLSSIELATFAQILASETE